MINEVLQKIIKDTIKSVYNIDVAEIPLEHPSNESFGDYSTTIALTLAKQLKQSPNEIAKKLHYELQNNIEELTFKNASNQNLQMFESIEYSSPGFINLILSSEWLTFVLTKIEKMNKSYGSKDILEKKDILVEFTDPNPFKVFHIGHLMSNCIGESVASILEFRGGNVKCVNYQGDVGMHVAKAIWGVLELLNSKKQNLDDIESLELADRVEFLGHAYALGAQVYDENGTASDQIKKLNALIFVVSQNLLKKQQNWNPLIDYSKNIDESAEILGYSLQDIQNIYEKGRQWSLDYFETIYKRLGTKFDAYYFESLVGEFGYSIVKNNIKNGVFEESEGAIVFKGEKYGLHTRVFINSLGFPTYEAKELGLAVKKYEDHRYDLSYIVTGNEIAAYFKVLLKALALVNKELAEKTTHIPHGMLKLKSGKMSSRTGTIISGEALINEVKNAVLAKMETERAEEVTDEIIDQIAIGAIKYDILKQNIGSDIIFDQNEAISLTGNTGPYLQYTHARAMSVLEKSGIDFEKDLAKPYDNYNLHKKEKDILRHIYKFPEIVERGAKEFAPNLICTYLFELAQRYNSFYNDVPILSAKTKEEKEFRVLLTKSVAQVLKNGLYLLGIAAPSKM